MLKVKTMNPRTRALIAIGLTIIMLTLFFLFILIRQQKLTLSNTIHNEQQSQKKMMELLLEQTAQRYKSRIKSLVTNKPQVMRAFAAQDRDELLRQSNRLLKIFKKENPYFKAFFFVSPDNTIFLRVHKPELYGDNMTYLSPVALEGNRTRKMHAGLEIVKAGLYYRIVYPVFVEGKYIGLAGFGINVDFFLNQLHPANHTHLNKDYQEEVDIALVFPKSKLKKTVFLDKAAKIIGEYAIFANSNTCFQKLSDHLDLEKEIQQTKLNGICYTLLHTAYFKDFKGDKIAWGISLLNTEDLVAGTKHTIVMVIIFASALLFFTFIILYFNFNLLFKKITVLNNSLEQSNQELEYRVEIRTAALQESEQKFHMLFDEVPDAIFTITL
ncbi:MAG: hypothetical protein KAJ62_06075, partial [Desulfobacteraceae bacterium]|nr:hypothetical protein [Desulfobacteraceae bacterium]